MSDQTVSQVVLALPILTDGRNVNTTKANKKNNIANVYHLGGERMVKHLPSLTV